MIAQDDSWQQNGIWDKIHGALRTKVRQSAGKKSKLTVAIFDSQSVKTTEQGGQRWIVERTFGWLNRCRRLAKDYE